MRKLGTAGIWTAGLSCLAIAIKVVVTLCELKQGRRPNLVYAPEEEVVLLERSLMVCGVLAFTAFTGVCVAIAAIFRDRARGSEAVARQPAPPG
jgi:hypothetical protein